MPLQNREELIKYELTCITWVISLWTWIKISFWRDRLIGYNLQQWGNIFQTIWIQSIPWMFFLLAIRYHDSPPCLLSVLLKDCTRKMIPVKKKGVSIKHKCVLLMFIKGSLQTLYVIYMWLTENWNQFLVSFTGK